MGQVAPLLYENPHHGTGFMCHLISQVPLAMRDVHTRAGPYVLPAGMRYVPAFAPLRPNEQVRGEAVTAGVFCVSSFSFSFPFIQVTDTLPIP